MLPVLVGDVGGTNTRMALWSGRLEGFASWATAEVPSLAEALAHYRETVGLPQIAAAAVAVAGPVRGERATLSNTPWCGSIADFTSHGFDGCFLNDLEAGARAIPMLGQDDLLRLSGPPPVVDAPAAMMGIGTGLGEAGWLGGQAWAGEGGHVAFTPTDPELDALLAWGRQQVPGGWLSLEHVLSGPGLGRLLAFARTEVEASQEVVAGLAAGVLPAALVHAHWRHCPASAKAVDLFVRIAAHEAGSLGIRLLARGGVYISGGVARRFADALSDGRFAEALVSPPAKRPLRASLPVLLVTHPNPVLMGAVTAACDLLGPSS